MAGWSLPGSDRETVRRLEKGELRRTARAFWYEAPGESGVRKLYLYPTPSGGDPIELEYVYEGPTLSVDTPTGEPSEFPEWFHPKLLHFLAEVYYESVEDNPELAEVHKAKADGATSELIRYDNERGSGEGIFQIGIVGVTA